jgi:histidine ammonia-lyase
MIHCIEIDGQNLKTELLWEVSRAALDPHSKFKISLSESARTKILKAEKFVDSIVQKGNPVYGINTGFGKFAEVAISKNDLSILQENLILSHACGVGPALGRDLVMSMWLIRLNVLARGNSGIRLSSVDLICKTLEAGILAVVPARGSVGASGDLAPSAHATLTLLGKGMCTLPRDGAFAEISASEALKVSGIQPLTLIAKEGLALINGTQTTSSLALKATVEGKNLLHTANLAMAMSLEALRGSHVVFDSRIAKVRNQPGAVACAQEIENWVAGKTEISESHEDCGRVQDPYSVRCAPQVHGAIYDSLIEAEQVIEREINASTDNPLLFPEEGLSLSGGNFHAIYTARVSDQLCSALTTLSSISERRIALLMAKDSSGLPAFLVKDGGLNSGFMMAQVTAAALVSENKTLSFPASVDSIPTSDDREDHVSMGVGAGLKLQQIVENLKYVLAIELMAACQAIDLLRPLKSSKKIEGVHSTIRSRVKRLDQDRILSDDFKALCELIESRVFFNN